MSDRLHIPDPKSNGLTLCGAWASAVSVVAPGDWDTSAIVFCADCACRNLKLSIHERLVRPAIKHMPTPFGSDFYLNQLARKP